MNAVNNELRRLCAEPLPHPNVATQRRQAESTLTWLIHHLDTLADQPIGLAGTRAELETLLRTPPPEDGTDFENVLAEFATKVAPYCFRINHPRFLAFIPSAPTFPALLGDLLCAGTNFFAGVWLEAAGAAQVELLVLDWFVEFLGLPASATGVLTGGGSEANLTALVAGREPLSHEDRSRAVLYVSELRHWSVDRAARVIGLRPDQIRPVAADEDYRLRPESLQTAVTADRAAGRRPWLVVANAGATSTGTIDPLDSLATVCGAERLWLHVDAAYGWPIALLDEGKQLLKGIERADSLTLDPHKWFGQTFEVGCLLLREGRRLTQTFAIRPEYMQDVEPAEDEVNFADRGIALTRRFRALKIWFSLKVLGVRWFRDLVAHGCHLARYAQAVLEATPGLEILSARQLGIVCFRWRPPGFAGTERELDQINLTLAERLRLTGRAFLSTTRLKGQVALRFCFVNWRTTAADVDEVVDLLVACAS